MPPELTNAAQQDESAVAAVRRGDAERYRELVERHERRVYAVAWSRLGDAALAEEVTQEAFIRAYRRLWLLGDGAKFTGWVNTIARHVAINFGLRHRRELNKRKRWALENPGISTAENSADETDPLHTPETLRQALAELPAAQRECLVLFYLEGKSGAEAAATLGISESALRVRLHRARAALRARLEEKLEGSLAQLRPARTLVPAIMTAVLASSSAKAATAGGIGATILGTLAKFTPFKWLFTFFIFIPLLLPLVMTLPGLFFHRWRTRDEQQNYRDPEGFRASLHRQFDQSHLVFLAFLIGMILLFATTTTRVLGAKELFLIIGLFTLGGIGFSARQLEINCRRSQISALFSNFIMCAVCLSVAASCLPVIAVIYTCLFSSFLTMFTNRSRPLRMDYNLFLRATQGMLPPIDLAVQKGSSVRFDRAALRAFARFLGERQLVNNFRWGADGLVLYLPAMKSPFVKTWAAIFPSVRRNSYIALGWDGSVAAHCGKNDAAGLAALQNNSTPDLAPLKNQVAAAVAWTWQSFREENIPLAERAIGQIPDTEIFIVPPIRTTANRWQRLWIGSLMAAALILLGTSWLFSERLSGLKPVSVSDAQVHEFMSLVSTNPNPLVPENIGGTRGYTRKSFAWDPDMALFTCMLLPETNLFTVHGLQMLRASIFSGEDPQIQDKSKNLWLCQTPLAKRALFAGWIGWPDLNLTPEDVSKEIHQGKYHEIEFQYDYLLARESAWSWVESKRWEVMRANEMTLSQLRWLRAVNCLDLVDREKLIQQIASVQTLSGKPPGNPPIHDWKDVRGLFFTPCYPALQDTYSSLAALEILGGLDRIDREACIKGILRRHEGKGFFTSPSSGNYNEYHIDGSTRDTIAAYESLRILGALGRVKDLDQWRFRVASYRASKPDANGVRVLTWDEIEAWVCQQRLEKILRERKENPQAPARSLLDP